MRTNQRAQWYPITVIAEQIVQDRLAELEEMEWEARLRHPSRQRDALRAIINEGRQAYADGEAEEIVGDTFA